MFAVFPAPYVASSGGVTSLAFQDDAYSSGATIDITGLTQAGDLIVLSDFAVSIGSIPTLVTPSAFTNWINFADPGNVRVAVSYKIATGSETTLTGMNGDFGDDKILVIFRGNTAISSITASTPTTQVTNGDPSSQSIIATNGTLPLVALGIYVNGLGSAIDPRDMTPTETGELNSITSHYLLYNLQNSSLADVTIDMADEGTSNMLAGGYLWAA